jgi:hypothetical protein
MMSNTYWKTVYATTKIADTPSDVAAIGFDNAIMGDMVFHNVRLLNQFFNKGGRWG